MTQLDRVPKIIFDYWKSLESTDKLLGTRTIFTGIETHILFCLVRKGSFNQGRTLAFDNSKKIIYYWEDRLFTEQEYIKLIKMKAFL